MFYVIKNNNLIKSDNEDTLIKFYNEALELPEDYDESKYMIVDNQLVLNDNYQTELLVKSKQSKIELNDRLRDEALLGGVLYQNILFDSDTDQKINLSEQNKRMSDTDTVVWYGMNGGSLLCTKADIQAIGDLIYELTAFVWGMNDYIKEQIAEAETVEEVEAIEIDYDNLSIT